MAAPVLWGFGGGDLEGSSDGESRESERVFDVGDDWTDEWESVPESAEISVEFESRVGISVHKIPTAHLTRAQHAVKSPPRRRKVPGEWRVSNVEERLVRDPLLLAGLGFPVSADDDLCCRGSKVVLREGYAKKNGMKGLVGLIGVLGQRSAVGSWCVMFPSQPDKVVHVGKDGTFGLVYAERQKGTLLSANAASRRWEREWKALGKPCGTFRECNEELRVARRRPARADQGAAAGGHVQMLARMKMMERVKGQEALEKRVAGGRVFWWSGSIIDEVLSDNTLEPMMLVYRDSQELLCLADAPEYTRVLEEGEEIPGLVVDGQPWFREGTLYECVKGARVMVCAHVTRSSKYLRHACGQGGDGERAVGLLMRRERPGEWWVRFAEGELRMPVGLGGEYALQYVDRALWAAREHRFRAIRGHASDRSTHPRTQFWPQRSSGLHNSGKAVCGVGSQPQWHRQMCVCEGGRLCKGKVCRGIDQHQRGVSSALEGDSMGVLWT